MEETLITGPSFQSRPSAYTGVVSADAATSATMPQMPLFKRIDCLPSWFALFVPPLRQSISSRSSGEGAKLHCSSTGDHWKPDECPSPRDSTNCSRQQFGSKSAEPHRLLATVDVAPQTCQRLTETNNEETTACCRDAHRSACPTAACAARIICPSPSSFAYRRTPFLRVAAPAKGTAHR